MNKKLESLIDRVPTWPQEAQDEAKLAALRETLNRSIARGGSYTDEEVAADIEREHANAEREGR